MSEPLSGFPEWLPEQEIVQQQIIDIVRKQFELFGFTPIRTRAVERVEDLLSQGDTDKEIYGVHRLAAADGEETAARIGLHYDLTVPLARYVAEHRSQLVFPFRRYQIQPAWRGERPQLGRYREFIQADADIIGNGTLDARYDVEMIQLLRWTLTRLPVPPVKLLVNSRKVLEGFYRGLGIESVTNTLRAVDKLAKIGEQKVLQSLEQSGLTTHQAEKVLALSRLQIATVDQLNEVRALGVRHELLDEGLHDLEAILRMAASDSAGGSIVAALHIARGFDYYTGTVVEGVLEGHPQLGSVCSGGRYDNLVSSGSGPKLPGMGVSIGVTRLMAFCLHLKLLASPRRTPAVVMVVVHSEEGRASSDAVAAWLRRRAIPCFVSDSAAAYGKQIRVASQLGIPYVLFPAGTDKGDEVRDIRTGEQTAIDLATWIPDEAAAVPR